MTPSPTTPEPPAGIYQTRWFAEEVHPHEPALRAFLRSRFPSLQDVDDLVQEAYVRLFQARAKGTVTNVKSYLFTTARNIALDLFRRDRAAPMGQLLNFDRSSVLEEGRDVAETICHEQELQLLREAIDALPDRCREVLLLRKFENLSRPEIARRMGISEGTVSVHLQLGVMRCQRFFLERGLFPGGKA